MNRLQNLIVHTAHGRIYNGLTYISPESLSPTPDGSTTEPAMLTLMIKTFGLDMPVMNPQGLQLPGPESIESRISPIKTTAPIFASLYYVDAASPLTRRSPKHHLPQAVLSQEKHGLVGMRNTNSPMLIEEMAEEISFLSQDPHMAGVQDYPYGDVEITLRPGSIISDILVMVFTVDLKHWDEPSVKFGFDEYHPVTRAVQHTVTIDIDR